MGMLKFSAATIPFLACLSLFSPALFSQEFSAVDRDLEYLEKLITGTLLNTEEQQKLLEDLQLNLSMSGSLIENYESTIIRQEKLLSDLQTQLNEMSETYRRQSDLSAKYAKSSRFWRTFTLIGIPATAALCGGLAWAITR